MLAPTVGGTDRASFGVALGRVLDPWRHTPCYETTAPLGQGDHLSAKYIPGILATISPQAAGLRSGAQSGQPKVRQPDHSHRQLAVPGMHGGEVYGDEANAPTFGARTQSPAWLVSVVAEPCRGATLLRAAEASLAYAAAATSAAATMVILVIVFSTWWQKPGKLGSWKQVQWPAWNISSRRHQRIASDIAKSNSRRREVSHSSVFGKYRVPNPSLVIRSAHAQR
jgi:hypothetical protein